MRVRSAQPEAWFVGGGRVGWPLCGASPCPTGPPTRMRQRASESTEPQDGWDFCLETTAQPFWNTAAFLVLLERLLWLNLLPAGRNCRCSYRRRVGPHRQSMLSVGQSGLVRKPGSVLEAPRWSLRLQCVCSVQNRRGKK